MPMAVPSWEVVLMMPEAEPRQYVSTSVPRPVVATEDTPMPAPATAAQAPRPAGPLRRGSAKVCGGVHARPRAIPTGARVTAQYGAARRRTGWRRRSRPG